MEKPELQDADEIGWTCPVCAANNERVNLLCNHCGFVREFDYPMDDELEEDSGPQEP